MYSSTRSICNFPETSWSSASSLYATNSHPQICTNPWDQRTYCTLINFVPLLFVSIMPSTQAPTSSKALFGSFFLFNRKPCISAGLNILSGTLFANFFAMSSSCFTVSSSVASFSFSPNFAMPLLSVDSELFVSPSALTEVMGVSGGVGRSVVFESLDSGEEMMSLVRGRSAVYMRSKICLIWPWVALLNATWWSTRPGRMRASSSFSGWLVVITSTRPSWDATPNLCQCLIFERKFEGRVKGEGRILPSMMFNKPLREIPCFFSSSDSWFAFLIAFVRSPISQSSFFPLFE